MGNDWLKNLYTEAFLSRFKEKDMPEVSLLAEELRLALQEILPDGGRILLVGSGSTWAGKALVQNPAFDVDIILPEQEDQAILQQEEMVLEGRVHFIHGVPAPEKRWDLVFIFDGYDFLSSEQRLKAIEILEGYAEKYLLVGTYNPENYWYWIWRLWMSLNGDGERFPLHPSSTEETLTLSGWIPKAQALLGTALTQALVHWIYGIQEPVRNLIREVHRAGVVSPNQSALYRIVALQRTDEVFPLSEKYWQSLPSPAIPGDWVRKDVLIEALSLATRAQDQSQHTINLLQEQVNYLTKKNQELLERVARFEASPVWQVYLALNKIRQAILPSGGRVMRYLNRLALLRKIRRFVFRNLYAELMDILKEHSDVKGIIVFPPSIEWKAALYQRPQHLAMAFAREGYLVFYCQPEYIPTPKGFHQLAPRLYLAKVEMKLFANISRPIVFFYPYNRDYLSFFTEPRVIYEYIDELEVFSRPLPELEANHRFFLRNAELVVATADKLLEQVRSVRPDALLVPNGVDYSHFEQVWKKSAPPPADLEPVVRMKHPIVGYYGALARWFDYDLLRKVAALRPDLNFVLIGPDYDGTVHQAHLEEFSNVFWLGKKDYALLPDYLRYFDVCMIPFVVNDITHSTSPLKLFEYMAARKPVVITPMRESMKTRGVLVAGTPQTFSTKIDEALNLRNDAGYQNLATEEALHNTWQVRAQSIAARLVPTVTGPEFNFALQSYLERISAGLPKETFALWLNFAKGTIERGAKVADRLRNWIDFREKSFLDVGCAYGGFLIAFSQRGCSRVVGIDVNQDLLDLAAINLREKGVQGELYCLNVESSGFNELGTFDFLTCNDVIEHVSNPSLTLSQLAKALKPGGVLYMEIPNPFWYRFLWNDGHYNLPGITLLTPKDAEVYFKSLYPDIAYGVNEYHLIDWYIHRIKEQGLEAQLLNERWVEPSLLLREMKDAIKKMEERLSEIQIPSHLVEKIRRRAHRLYRYVERRAYDPNEYTHLCQMFGTDFWILLAKKR